MKNSQFIICFCVLKTILIVQACSNNFNNSVCFLNSYLTESLLTDSSASESIDTFASIIGVTNFKNNKNGEMLYQTNLNITKYTTNNCPSLQEADSLTTTELINRLTAPCSYDRLERPPTDDLKPIEVTARVYVSVFNNIGASHFKFNMQALLQLRYIDRRLAFSNYAPARKEPLKAEATARNLIWVPHLFFTNEEDSSVLGTFDKDILTTISPNGTVILATRIQATIFCWSHQIKFPFDEQYCVTTLESWMFNASDVILSWEQVSPISLNSDMQFGQYLIADYWHNSTLVNSQSNGLWHGGLIGNYSSLSFTIHLVHSAGYYIMDFFIPCMIMVAISWVSFWLRADQTPARTIMCCSTMLSLITLASSQLRSSSSFITIFEIWFLGCCLFIFGALIEFAFSNTIFRRKKNIRLKKVNSKSILKSTLVPRTVKKSETCNAQGCATLDCISLSADPTVVMTNCSSIEPNSTMTTSPSTVSFAFSYDSCSTHDIAELPEQMSPPPTIPKQTFATMTGQEISMWLDRKARFMFPIAFIIFNVFFWMFILLL